jgi:hypothetical protein
MTRRILAGTLALGLAFGTYVGFNPHAGLAVDPPADAYTQEETLDPFGSLEALIEEEQLAEFQERAMNAVRWASIGTRRSTRWLW